MSKVLLDEGDSIAAKSPKLFKQFGDIKEGDKVWAFRRSDWNLATVVSIRKPTKDNARFSVIDANTKQQYLTDTVLSQKDFFAKLPCVDASVW